MDRWVGKVALVTGASAGIGEAIARALVLAGLEVVGVARRVERIEALADSLKGAKGKLHAIKCDVTIEEDILKAFKWTNEELGGLDVLVNNAGVGTAALVTEDSSESYKKILDTNVLAVAICTREGIKSMRSRTTQGHIFFINSDLGYNATAFDYPSSVYPASKFAVRGFVENVKHEIDMAGDNIKTTSIIPGVVKTDIFTSAGAPADLMKDVPYVEPKDIGDGVIYALSRSPNVRVDEMKITPMNFKP